MFYVGLAFLTLFTAFFVREVVSSLHNGKVSSRRWFASRAGQPFQFWMGLCAWIFIAIAGALMTLFLIIPNVR